MKLKFKSRAAGNRVSFWGLVQEPGSKPQFRPDEDGRLHNLKEFGLEGGTDEKDQGTGGDAPGRILVIPGNLGFAGQVLAQSDVKTPEDKQLQELRQKRQEQWEEREREAKQLENTGKRNQDAIKRQQDAGQRQKAAEQRQRELEEEEN